MFETVLVTGGTGYVGSHACVALTEAGYKVIILDNFSNSSPIVLERLKSIVGASIELIEGDVRNFELLCQIFSRFHIKAVIHFAGLKAVGESIAHPLDYYDNNVRGTLELLKAMNLSNVRTLVFSSSASVYGDPGSGPTTEDSPLVVTSPYGRSKLFIEDILQDLYLSAPEWSIARLRYFNPIGAHASGLIGEDPKGKPANLVPYISHVAVGRQPKLYIYGNDFPTYDGTAIRDYIHITDLADGHVAALRYCLGGGKTLTVNLGTGKGASVFDVVKAFEKASSRPIPYQIVARRPGDAAECLADPSLAFKLLGWKATRDLDQMCEDSWRWQAQNPHGFK